MEIENKQKENTFVDMFSGTKTFENSLSGFKVLYSYNLCDLNQEQLLLIGLLGLKIFRDENNFYVETDDYLIQKTLSKLKTEVIEEPIKDSFLMKIKKFLKIIE
jgi:hypothetical protein